MSDDDYNFYAPGDYPANYPTDQQKAVLAALASKDEYFFQQTLHQYGRPYGVFYKGLTLLELAAKYDFTKGIEILLSNSTYPNEKPYKWEKSALDYAIINNNYHMAKMMLDKGATPNNRFDYAKGFEYQELINCTLGLAIEEDAPHLVQLLLERGANVHATHNQEPLITFAAKKAHPSIVEILCLYNANVNAQDKDGNTALHIAALNGKSKLVKNLIEKHHANTIIQNNNKDLPMHMAMQNPNIEVLKLLQKHGTPIYQENIGKESVASLAVKSNNSEILKTIFHWLRPYESIYLKDPMINSLLLSSIQSKSVVSTTHLLKHTPDLNAPIYEGMNPLQYICEREDEQQLNALLSFDGQLDINKQDNLGYTALHYACKRQNKQMVLALLEKGADATLKNHFGEDSLFIAKQTNNLDFLNFVKEAISTPNKARLITKQPPLKSALNRTDRQNS